MKIHLSLFSARATHIVSLAIALVFVAAAYSEIPAQPASKQPPSRGMNLSSVSSVKQLPARTKRFALIVGVDKYADTQITTLGGASNDARALAGALVGYAGFPADQVILLASTEPAERQPTRGNILRRLSNLAAVVPKDGLLLFAFASHGMERGGQAFLLPSDAQVSDDVTLLEQTAVNVAQIKDWVRKSGVKQVVLILDACRNDPAGRANMDNPLTPTYTRGFNFDVRNREVEAFATLYATAIGHRAFEYKEKKQGYFTWALVEGLRGAAANERGEVTLAGLIKYLQDRVSKQVLIDLGPGKVQRPFAVVEGYKADDLVIAMTKPDQTTVINNNVTVNVSAPSVETPTGTSLTAKPSLEGTVWTGSDQSGEYTIEFLKDGQLRYLVDGIRNGEKHQFVTKGTWKQADNFVQIVVGNAYSTWQGNIEGGVIKGEATNFEGTKWKWVLMPKAM
ncbi:MAG TPA: caspase family protein [Pyrinomonadaceae bacterium]|jgi:hypothetical protein|nr:caspase family protein [Pyrinomonadaceae bacterium]